MSKKYMHDRLVWIDLEMTGLDYLTDVTLEIATVVTDADLNIIATGPNLIIHQEDNILDGMNMWCTEQHAKTGLTQAVKDSTVSMQEAEEQTLRFLEQHCQRGNAPLCGNTVWFDKLFLKKDMPRIYDFLHYRIVDVTSLKVMLNMWSGYDIFFEKKNTHRALDDIYESIEELKFYKQHCINTPSQKITNKCPKD